ncbi:MAG: prolyl-tRNA synthetase associated domain-containing protein [Acidimicrobiia bacterium]|nr:prolyl-tRNA synthetase associated domain-containing protein [Acidimicrobiia bacterium]
MSQCTPAQLLSQLEAMGIETATRRHEPVFTVEQAKTVRAGLPGTHCKNLFLKNKKGAMWLVVLAEDHRLDLNELGERLGSGRLSFASERRLEEYLGVIPGAVTPLAVINDADRAVTVVIERSVLGNDPINCHPLDNSMTTAISAADLTRFLEFTGHAPVVIDLD